MRLKDQLLAIYLICCVILTSLCKDDGGIRMEIDISGLMPQNGVWESDMHMKLSSPQHSVLLCNVKIVGMNNRKIPCEIPRNYIKQGHNEYHVTIYSSKSGKIYAHMDASFDVNDEIERNDRIPFAVSILDAIRGTYQNAPLVAALAISTYAVRATYFKICKDPGFPPLFTPLSSPSWRADPPTLPASDKNNQSPGFETQKTDLPAHGSIRQLNRTTSYDQMQRKPGVSPLDHRKLSQKTDVLTYIGRSIVGAGVLATGLILNDRKESYSKVGTSNIHPPPISPVYSRRQTEYPVRQSEFDTSHLPTIRHSEDLVRNRDFDPSQSSTLRVLTKTIWNLIKHGKVRESDN